MDPGGSSPAPNSRSLDDSSEPGSPPDPAAQPGTAGFSHSIPGGAAKVVVSACLAGRACRYDGGANPRDSLDRLVAEGRAVLVCPEVDGGLPTPRPPAEIVGGDGGDVLDGRARVVTVGGDDVTEIYIAGAHRALDAARRSGATQAILKARSPSCGKGTVYDGTFSQTLTAGDGVTTALLRRNGIQVVTEDEP